MVTRVRIEVSAKTKPEAQDELLSAAQLVITENPGRWTEEEPGVQTMPSTKGVWGRYTIRREREDD